MKPGITDRHNELFRMAVIYFQRNFTEACLAFVPLDDADDKSLTVDGLVIDEPTEDEMDSLLGLL